MFGCFIMLLVRSDSFAASAFKALTSAKIKTGTKGMTANKGAVALRFNFFDTSFMFMNCHLTSGQNKSRQRMDDANLTYSGVT